MICILAASTGAERSVGFTALVALLVIGIIGAARPRRAFVAAVERRDGAGPGGVSTAQLGVQRHRQALENSFIYWFNQFRGLAVIPDRSPSRKDRRHDLRSV